MTNEIKVLDIDVNVVNQNSVIDTMLKRLNDDLGGTNFEACDFNLGNIVDKWEMLNEIYEAELQTPHRKLFEVYQTAFELIQDSCVRTTSYSYYAVIHKAEDYVFRVLVTDEIVEFQLDFDDYEVASPNYPLNELETIKTHFNRYQQIFWDTVAMLDRITEK
jgi:hypothetical protein